jgi:hypothetical protein
LPSCNQTGRHNSYDRRQWPPKVTKPRCPVFHICRWPRQRANDWILSHTAKLIIAVAVFALGVPIGAAIAAWVMPPS